MNIYFYHGEDSFSIGEAVRRFRDKHKDKMIEELELSDDLSDADLRQKLQETLESQSLFAQDKLVILKNFLGGINQFEHSEAYLLDALKQTKTDIVFVQSDSFDKRLKFYKALQQQAKTKEFALPTGKNLEKWISKQLEKDGYDIEPKALQRLISRMSGEDNETLYDLWQIESELKKLMLYKLKERQIVLADIITLVPRNITQNVFVLTNLFADGQTQKTLRLLEQMVGRGPAAGVKSQSIKIIGALAGQLRSLLMVKDLDGRETSEIAQILKWKEGRVWINLKLAKKFEKAKLIQLLRDLQAIDRRLKTSEESPKLLLGLFFQKAAPHLQPLSPGGEGRERGKYV